MASTIKRILHVAPTPFFSDRGCHVRIRGIVRGLQSLGITNRVCTYSIGRDIDDVDAVRCLHVPGYKNTEPGPSAFKYLMDPLLLLTVVRQIWKFKPNVLHCHLHEGLLIGWVAKFLALRSGLVIGFDMQGGLTEELDSYGYLNNRGVRGLFRFVERIITAMPDSFYCSSTTAARLLAEDFSVDPHRIIVAPDGADVVLSDQTTPARSANDHPTAIYTGGLVESKGLSILKEAIRQSADRNLPVGYLIIGYPTEDLQDFVDRNELTNCKLVGRVPFEELGTYLRKGTLCLDPKSGDTSEASGKVMNYMAAGLPVVCFDTPNNRELLGDQGYFASEPNATAFVDQIELALGNPDEAANRGRAAAEHAAKRYSWRASAEKINAGYKAILV